jgi:hypothetical protein
MASFFKRAVTAALERREEVQDQNIVLQEKAVEENLDRLKKVEELRLKRNKALKDYKKYMPMIQSAAMKADSGISSVPEPLVLNLLQQSGGDPYIAARAAEKMAKASPETFNQLSSDATKAQGDMTSATQTSSRMLPSQQKSAQLADQTEQLVREGDVDYGKIGSTFATSMLNVLTGQPMRSTREITKERFMSIFPDDKQAQEAYDFATDVLSEGMPDTIPAMKDPEKMDKVFRFARIAKGEEKFNEKLDTTISRQTSGMLSLLKTNLKLGESLDFEALRSGGSENFITNLNKNNALKNNKQAKAALLLYMDYTKTIRARARSLYNSAAEGVYDASTAVEKAMEMDEVKDMAKVINATEVTGQSTADTTKKPPVEKGPNIRKVYDTLGVNNLEEIEELATKGGETGKGWSVRKDKRTYILELNGVQYYIQKNFGGDPKVEIRQ